MSDATHSIPCLNCLTDNTANTCPDCMVAKYCSNRCLEENRVQRHSTVCSAMKDLASRTKALKEINKEQKAGLVKSSSGVLTIRELANVFSMTAGVDYFFELAEVSAVVGYVAPIKGSTLELVKYYRPGDSFRVGDMYTSPFEPSEQQKPKEMERCGAAVSIPPSVIGYAKQRSLHVDTLIATIANAVEFERNISSGRTVQCDSFCVLRAVSEVVQPGISSTPPGRVFVKFTADETETLTRTATRSVQPIATTVKDFNEVLAKAIVLHECSKHYEKPVSYNLDTLSVYYESTIMVKKNQEDILKKSKTAVPAYLESLKTGKPLEGDLLKRLRRVEKRIYEQSVFSDVDDKVGLAIKIVFEMLMHIAVATNVTECYRGSVDDDHIGFRLSNGCDIVYDWFGLAPYMLLEDKNPVLIEKVRNSGFLSIKCEHGEPVPVFVDWDTKMRSDSVKKETYENRGWVGAEKIAVKVEEVVNYVASIMMAKTVELKPKINREIDEHISRLREFYREFADARSQDCLAKIYRKLKRTNVPWLREERKEEQEPQQQQQQQVRQSEKCKSEDSVKTGLTYIWDTRTDEGVVELKAKLRKTDLADILSKQGENYEKGSMELMKELDRFYKLPRARYIKTQEQMTVEEGKTKTYTLKKGQEEVRLEGRFVGSFQYQTPYKAGSALKPKLGKPITAISARRKLVEVPWSPVTPPLAPALPTPTPPSSPVLRIEPAVTTLSQILIKPVVEERPPTITPKKVSEVVTIEESPQKETVKASPPRPVKPDVIIIEETPPKEPVKSETKERVVIEIEESPPKEPEKKPEEEEEEEEEAEISGELLLAKLNSAISRRRKREPVWTEEVGKSASISARQTPLTREEQSYQKRPLLNPVFLYDLLCHRCKEPGRRVIVCPSNGKHGFCEYCLMTAFGGSMNFTSVESCPLCSKKCDCSTCRIVNTKKEEPVVDFDEESRLIEPQLPQVFTQMQHHTIDLSMTNVKTMKSKMLTDEEVLYIIEETVKNVTVRSDFHIFDTHFMSKLESVFTGINVKHTMENVYRSWIRPANIFSKDFLVIPINRTIHWFLIVVCFASNEVGTFRGAPIFLVFDSFTAKADVATECERIRKILIFSWKKEIEKTNASEKPLRLYDPENRILLATTPKQVNGTDCGVFMTVFIRLLFGANSKKWSAVDEMENTCRWATQQQIYRERQILYETMKSHVERKAAVIQAEKKSEEGKRVKMHTGSAPKKTESGLLVVNDFFPQCVDCHKDQAIFRCGGCGVYYCYECYDKPVVFVSLEKVLQLKVGDPERPLCHRCNGKV